MNAPFSTAIARRKTVEDLVAARTIALEKFQAAHGTLHIAENALKDARDAARSASNGINRYNLHQQKERDHFITGIKVSPRADYMATARKMVDTDCWAHVIELTDLQILMDVKAKEELQQSLMGDDCPEFTVDNVLATLERFMADAGMIWRRGIAEAFTRLDRRFKSHDGWKIGNRIILTYVFDSNGWWNYSRSHEDTFMDVERVFKMLDGEKPKLCDLNAALRSSRNSRHGAHQTFVETDYFRIRAWKNGNVHVWFKRDDLLDRVNQLLGEYYDAPIPEDREPDEANPFEDVKHLPAKNYGFYPTPEPAVKAFMSEIHLLREKGEKHFRILEPSAGTGNLARACMAKVTSDETCHHRRYDRNHLVDCIEIQPALADALRSEGIFNRVTTADFLHVQPDVTGLYDRVIMNPPFDRERDIDHVMHALKFLKPDGQLCAIMSAGTEVRSTKKSQAFRELMNSMGCEWKDMPAGSFSSVGTNCNTGILKVFKNGTKGSWRQGFRDFD